jgi:hypothetical protein
MSHKGKHPYELNPVDFVNNPTHRAHILEGLEGFLKLDYTLDHSPVAEGPAEAARKWIRQVIDWAQCNKGYAEQIEEVKSGGMTRQQAEDMVDDIRKDVIGFHKDVDRSLELIKEMQARPDADPALDYIGKALRRAKSGGGIDVFALSAKAVRHKDVEQIMPVSLQQIAHRLRSRSGPVVSQLEVIEAIEALPESLRKHRDLVGRGLTEPKVTYDPVVTEVKQYIENVQAARGYLSQADMPDQLEEVEDYLVAHLRWLMAPRHNLNPVMELKHIAEIMRDWIAAESLASHVKFDMSNMVESLEKLAAQHAAAPVEVKLDGSGTRTVSRLEHTLEVLSGAADAHPLDIDQQKLREVELWLKAIVLNNPGFKNLGQEGYILVPAGNNVPGRVVDAVNDYLIMYGQGTHKAEDLRGQAARSGSAAICNMPEWFAQTYGHVSKGGFASLMYHTMLAVAAQDEPKGVYLKGAKVEELEAALKAGVKTAWTDFVESAEKVDAR